jgi:hypothetical protein
MLCCMLMVLANYCMWQGGKKGKVSWVLVARGGCAGLPGRGCLL